MQTIAFETQPMNGWIQMIKRVLREFRKDTRLLILNDEAHHCYLPKQAKRNTEKENSKTENERAAVWFTGLREIAQRFKVQAVYPTVKSHVNLVVADTDGWEQIAAKTLEEIEEVEAYVKNAYLGFTIPYVSAGKDRWYYPDFIARCRRKDTGEVKNLVIEITGMNQDKADKRWTMENYWLPAVNAIRAKYQMEKWEFIDIANDIRDIKNRLVEKIYQ